MVLPAADCPCDTGPDICCDTVFLLGDRVRTVAFDAVKACQIDGCCNEYRSWTTIGPQTADPFGDSVIVHMLRLYMPNTTGQGNAPLIGIHAADFRVEIRYTGWPQISAEEMGGTINVPGEAFNLPARHAMGHSEKAWRAIVDGVQRYTLFPPSTNPHIIHKQIAVTEMVPLAPAGPIVGHAFTVGVKFKL